MAGHSSTVLDAGLLRAGASSTFELTSCLPAINETLTGSLWLVKLTPLE
jgi:hypothetical protein